MYAIRSYYGPGPVLIDITKNAQLQLFDYNGYKSCIHVRIV